METTEGKCFLSSSADLTLLHGGRARTLGVVVPLLRRVVPVLRPRVRRGAPLLVAIVTVRRLVGRPLRLAELQPDPPVLLLHLSNPGLQRRPVRQPGRRGAGQAGRQQEGAPVCGDQTLGLTGTDWKTPSGTTAACSHQFN